MKLLSCAAGAALLVAMASASCGSNSSSASGNDGGTPDDASGGSSGGSSSSSGSGGSDAQSSGDAPSTSEGGSVRPTVGGLFTQPEPWTKDVSAVAKDANSDAIIAALASMGGWGGGRFQIDFSIPLFFADASTPQQIITAPSGGYCYGGPDCDPVPAPDATAGQRQHRGEHRPTSATRRRTTATCWSSTRSQKKLYELYNATKAGDRASRRSAAFVWDLTKAYPDNLRGDQCTSADAAGFPIAGLLPTADEVAAGE